MSYFPERVTVLTEELIPRERSYFRELLHREELLPWQRRSYWKRGLVTFLRKSYCSERGVITLKELP